MRNLTWTVFLLLFSLQTSAQYYTPYGAPAPQAPNNGPQRAPQYVPNIENNGPQVDQRRNTERAARELENMNTIRNYQIIYGDTYR
jgi:hypothetical protein